MGAKLIDNSYRVSGKTYPRLSQVVEQVPNIALREWKRRVGEEEAARISEETSEWGTAVHAITLYSDISDNAKLYQCLDGNRDLLIPLLSWDCWVIEFVNKWIAREKIVWSDRLRVAGTIDGVGELKGDKCLSLCDIKTGPLYDEMGIRLYGYRLMWNERNPRKKVTRCLAVSLPRKNPGEIKVKEYIDNNKNRYEARFIELCKDFHTLVGD